MTIPINQLISGEVERFFTRENQDDYTAAKVETILLGSINRAITYENINSNLKGVSAHTPIKTLPPIVVAECLLQRHRVVRITPSTKSTDPAYDIIAVYMDHGPDEGIYVTDETSIRALARQYHHTISLRELDSVMVALKDNAPRVKINEDKDLIAVNNGIFDYAHKKLLPFTPEIVFTAKSAVNWKENPINPVIHNSEDGTDWDIETWMNDLNDDPEVVTLLWEILSAIIRPNVSWDKTAWLLSEVGNNGKGTLLTLMRNLCGERAWTSIPVADFSKDFHLEPLTRANAILVDENDVGEYVDKAANFKAVVTNDVLLINRKNKTPIAHQFRGFMVQCVNDTPRFRDKSGSLYRRQLIIPFTKTFTGVERRYIKHDYMSQTEVLEYVLHKVLSGNFYELSEPDTVRNALIQYKIDNDPVRAFMEEFSHQFVWDLLPWRFLYALYRAWMIRDQPSSPPLGYQRFNKQLTLILQDSPSYGWVPTQTATRTHKRIMAPEPLIVEYDLTDWLKTKPQGGSANGIGIPHNIPTTARGLIRADSTITDDDDLPEDI